VVLCGLAIARLSRLPFVADFRDAWVLDESDPFGALHGSFEAPRSQRRIRLLRRLEEHTLRSARAILFTSTNTMTGYLARYPAIEARAHLILNGFDPQDFAGDAPVLSPPTIAHVGTVHAYQWDQVSMVLSAFAQAVSDSRLPEDARLCFVGPVGKALEQVLDAAVDELGLRERVFRIGAVSHGEAVRWIRGSRVLLLLAGENRYVRLSKISEYLAAQRPIIALAARGSATAADAARHGGRVLHEPSVDDVARALVDSFEAHACVTDATGTLDHPHPMNRITEAERLAAVLDNLAST
jgi:glycosyltransferase involved in cell wall biosynthesis